MRRLLSFFRRAEDDPHVASGFERRAMRQAGKQKLGAVDRPRMALLEHDTETYADRMLRALADKDAALERAQVTKKTRRHRVKAAELGPAAEAVTTSRHVLGEVVERVKIDYFKAVDAIGHLAHRTMGDRAKKFWKILFVVGDLVGVGLAYGVALDVAPLEGLLLGLGTVAALIVGGELGSELKLHAQREQYGEMQRAGRLRIPDEYAHLVDEARTASRWLGAVFTRLLILFGLGAVAVGVLRASSASVGIAVCLAVLTLVLSAASGLVSWMHADVFSDLLAHKEAQLMKWLKRREEKASSSVLGNQAAHLEHTSVTSEAGGHKTAAIDSFGIATVNRMRTKNPEVFGHGVDRQPKPAADAVVVDFVPPASETVGADGQSPS